jgi:ATPase subunit of ABC transporter with duplicated ATPase domains
VPYGILCKYPITFRQVLLTGANMSLTYGRRYGLVGRNGLGKSTLLRTISRRQLIIPKHISILHVEQVSILLSILIMALTLIL